MSDVRVNIGMTPKINKLLYKTMFANDVSRSLIVRQAIKKRYRFEKLNLIDGPFKVYARINIPRLGVAYIREMAHVNNVTISSIYCAIIHKYICGG